MRILKKFKNFVSGIGSETKRKLTFKEIEEILLRIKDCFIYINDMEEVEMNWQEIKPIDGKDGAEIVLKGRFVLGKEGQKITCLENFQIQAELYVQKDIDFEDLKEEISSAKSQLEGEEFSLRWFLHAKDFRAEEEWSDTSNEPDYHRIQIFYKNISKDNLVDLFGKEVII